MKAIRQKKIRELIDNNEVSGQQELLVLLEKSGFKVAQATLSRDFAEMSVVRSRNAEGRYRLVVPEETQEDIIKGLVGKEVLSVAANETSIIISTLPGRAHGIGSFLDRLRNPDILGTIAGDDTVLVIPATIKKISSIKSYIQRTLSQP
jgi:transcriptional regulator of arginine metabolism